MRSRGSGSALPRRVFQRARNSEGRSHGPRGGRLRRPGSGQASPRDMLCRDREAPLHQPWSIVSIERVGDGPGGASRGGESSWASPFPSVRSILLEQTFYTEERDKKEGLLCRIKARVSKGASTCFVTKRASPS